MTDFGVCRCLWKRRFRALIAECLKYCCLLLPFLSQPLAASELDLYRLASDIQAASTFLADDVKYSRGYGSVGQRADRLAREAAQLTNAIRQRRSASVIRTQFVDLNNRYEDLEDAFFRASRNYSSDAVLAQLSFISELFSELVNTYYYSAEFAPQRSVITVVNPVTLVRPARPNQIAPVIGYGAGHRVGGGETVIVGANRQKQRVSARARNDAHRTDVLERLESVQQRHGAGERVIRLRESSQAVLPPKNQ